MTTVRWIEQPSIETMQKIWEENLETIPENYYIQKDGYVFQIFENTAIIVSKDGIEFTEVLIDKLEII